MPMSPFSDYNMILQIQPEIRGQGQFRLLFRGEIDHDV